MYLRFRDSESRPMKTRTSHVRSPLGMICPALLAITPTSLGFWRTIGTHSTIVRLSVVEFRRVCRLIARQPISAPP